jgi:transcriptional regulator with XRE-family HTH domain
MNPTKNQATTSDSALGALLRQWRDMRGASQLELSLDTGISQRHISFIESGRSVPSRQTLMDIAQALDVPLRERNTLLQAAGYAAMYSESPWDAAEMKSVNRALERMLRQHEPFPAMVMDRYWNVLLTNASTLAFFNRFIDMSARTGPRNILHLMFDPNGMRPFLADWESTAVNLIQRVHRESVGRVVDDKTRELLAALLAYPGVKQEWKTPKVTSIAPHAPVIPLSFVMDDKVLHYFSMVATVGTPQAVTTQELRLECMFPADETTEDHHLAMLGQTAL